MLMIIVLVAVVAALFYYFIVKPYDYWKSRGVPQGKPMWILGDQWRLILGKQNLLEMLQYVYNQCPGTRYSGIYQFFLPTLVVKDPDLMKQVTAKDFENFTDHKTFLPEEVEPLWTKNLFALTGQKWHDMRVTLSPSFTSSKMKAMFVLIRECAENFVQHFLEKGEDIIELEMKDTFSRFTNDVIATTAFGVKVDSLAETDNDFYIMGKKTTQFGGFWKTLKILGYFLFPRVYAVLKLRLFDKDVSDFFVDLVNSTIKIREEQGIIRPDMIHLLMQARRGEEQIEDESEAIDVGYAATKEYTTAKGKTHRNITNEDIASQALLFFLAGFETVSTALCHISHELAVNPDIQERLREEICDTLENSEGKLTYEALSKMKYMDMVISEGLRKWPSPQVVDRVCTKPYTIEPILPGEKPVHLETGTTLWLPIFALHRDPEYFPDPERFDPERFNDENKRNIRPYTYIPFGLGPRNCIGSRFALMEIKAVLFYILLRFQLIPVEKTQIPLEMARGVFAAPPTYWLGWKCIQT